MISFTASDPTRQGYSSDRWHIELLATHAPIQQLGDSVSCDETDSPFDYGESWGKVSLKTWHFCQSLEFIGGSFRWTPSKTRSLWSTKDDVLATRRRNLCVQCPWICQSWAYLRSGDKWCESWHLFSSGNWLTGDSKALMVTARSITHPPNLRLKVHTVWRKFENRCSDCNQISVTLFLDYIFECIGNFIFKFHAQFRIASSLVWEHESNGV